LARAPVSKAVESAGAAGACARCAVTALAAAGWLASELTCGGLSATPRGSDRGF